ncbi:peptidoglycan-binding domain-containing protein [uncultured Roseibium sp.]|uniref:peptidoglycan-binding domain-containing protein n=1 Tax=uncultured Roseibium sp. TaxID=1936171 RepID=UPI0026338BAB|nr:peptidoglycan-binding domain-containing protein [uncultured Roseibium sp.]
MTFSVKKGHRGEHVLKIQRKLNDEALIGYSTYLPLLQDGIFGKNTRLRVEEFQMHNDLQVDGIVGPFTWGALFGGHVPADVQAEAQKAVVTSPSVASPPLEDGYLYLISGDIVPKGKRVPANLPRAKRHKATDCHYVFVDEGQFPQSADMMKAKADTNNLLIKEVMIIAHGGGGGDVLIGGQHYYFGGPTAHLFKKVKHRFVSDTIIWIFACNFAASRGQRNSFEADALTPNELMKGAGLNAMIDLAKASGCEVRATFMPHFGAFDGFPVLWASAYSSGKYEYNLSGRKLSAMEAIAILTDHVVGSYAQIGPALVYFMFD